MQQWPFFLFLSLPEDYINGGKFDVMRVAVAAKHGKKDGRERNFGIKERQAATKQDEKIDPVRR